MGTTSLLVEIVIIGFQVLAWVFLAALTLWGYKWVELSFLKDWSTPIAVGLVGVAYTFGLIFDNLVAAIISEWVTGTPDEGLDYEFGDHDLFRITGSEMTGVTEEKNLPGVTYRIISPIKMDAYIRVTDKDAHEYLQRMFNQNRLLRSASVNLMLIGIMASAFVLTRIRFSWWLFVTMLIGSAFLAALVIVIWQLAQKRYIFYLLAIHRILVDKSKAASSAHNAPRRRAREKGDNDQDDQVNAVK